MALKIPAPHPFSGLYCTCLPRLRWIISLGAANYSHSQPSAPKKCCKSPGKHILLTRSLLQNRWLLSFLFELILCLLLPYIWMWQWKGGALTWRGDICPLCDVTEGYFFRIQAKNWRLSLFLHLKGELQTGNFKKTNNYAHYIFIYFIFFSLFIVTHSVFFFLPSASCVSSVFPVGVSKTPLCRSSL